MTHAFTLPDVVGAGILALIALIPLFALQEAKASVPPAIAFQGNLTDPGGVPVNGTVSMAFTIYNAPTGGTSLWTETQPSVSVSGGSSRWLWARWIRLNPPSSPRRPVSSGSG